MRVMLRPLTGTSLGTCDWGFCDGTAVAERWNFEDATHAAWLPVCERHTGRKATPSSATLPCPECEGSGEVRFCSLCNEAHRGVPPYIGCAVGEKPCPTCSGSGVVPSPEAVEAAAQRIHELDRKTRVRGFIGEEMWSDLGEIQEFYRELARAALGEFLRLNKEGK